VAAELRIKEWYLEAIEAGNLAALPGPAYQLGFIRTYAQTLGLDPDEILRRFRAEGAGSVTTPQLSFLAPVPDRAVPTGAIVLVGIVMLLVGYGFWFLHTENERSLAASIPSVPAQLAPLALPPPVTPSAPAVVAVKPVVVAPNPAPAAVAPKPPAIVPATVAPAAPPPGKTIMATSDSWVEVKDATGNILFSRVMHAGDSWPVPDLPGLTLTAGNAGGTEIAENGTAGPPLGAAGTVVHNYGLTPPSTTPATPASPGKAAN
jgi:cytoskeleton protein RodZ